MLDTKNMIFFQLKIILSFWYALVKYNIMSFGGCHVIYQIAPQVGLNNI